MVNTCRSLQVKDRLSALGNRRVGILHGCLSHHTSYEETVAWANQTAQDQAA
ncbi:hypothetical protein Kisp01_67730 [Kineosporia sp. NBRC 101677]|nr:hypothetical protein Kisp01_67730 [Kineosporia sp. NBRC 101677]